MKKAEDLDERGKSGSLDIGKAKMVERLLSEDGNLKNKNEFKADIDKYIKFATESQQLMPDVIEVKAKLDQACSNRS